MRWRWIALALFFVGSGCSSTTAPPPNPDVSGGDIVSQVHSDDGQGSLEEDSHDGTQGTQDVPKDQLLPAPDVEAPDHKGDQAQAIQDADEGVVDVQVDVPTPIEDSVPASDDGACTPPSTDTAALDLGGQGDQGGSTSPYQGGWPFNPNKAEINDPGWDSTPAIGTVLPHFMGVDQYGDTVDLYDFAGQGKLVVLDVGTIFCAPCKGLAAFFATADPCHMDPYAWWNDSYESILPMIESGEILWITILFSNGGPTTEQVVHGWHEEFPSDHIAVLADANAELATYLDITGMPQILVLNEDMELLIYNTAGPKAGMDYLVNLNQ